RYYAAERIAIKPELPQLSVTESEKEQQIEFSATPINVFEKEMYFTCFIMCGIFLSFVLLSWITKISAILILIILQQLDFTVLLPMVVEAINPSIVPLVIFIFLFLLYDNYRQKFTAWTTRFSDDYFELTRRYKNHSETIRIEINRIVRFQCGRVAKNFDGSMKNLKNRFFGRFPANLEGRGQNRNEMVLTDGTIFYLPVLPTSKKCYGNNNWLVNTWNEQLYQIRLFIER
ncbi:MAG: hypothetical protein LBU34_08775, partial [Planctomycetaceae bacterium]|nr:hypothetical protein [Planctomycetaceae bacterium]